MFFDLLIYLYITKKIWTVCGVNDLCVIPVDLKFERGTIG